ncbi:MAG: hypothetical protein WD648_14070 [Planctomycetaceae bacterium]
MRFSVQTRPGRIEFNDPAGTTLKAAAPGLNDVAMIEGILERVNKRGFDFVKVKGMRDVFWHFSKLSGAAINGSLIDERLLLEHEDSEKDPRAVNARPAY